MENPSDDLRVQQLRFIGKILAGFTHEIKNHLAIVKESVGLMSDMMQIRKDPDPDFSPYLQIIRSIEEQIEKTIVHFRYLNRFAHRMDVPLSSFNINESLEELMALVQRFAAQKRITLRGDFREDLPSITSNPAILQFLVSSLIEDRMSKLEKDSTLIVKTDIINSSVAIRIVAEGKIREKESEGIILPPEMLLYFIDMLRGTISTQGEQTVIMLPTATSSDAPASLTTS